MSESNQAHCGCGAKLSKYYPFCSNCGSIFANNIADRLSGSFIENQALNHVKNRYGDEYDLPNQPRFTSIAKNTSKLFYDLKEAGINRKQVVLYEISEKLYLVGFDESIFFNFGANMFLNIWHVYNDDSKRSYFDWLVNNRKGLWPEVTRILSDGINERDFVNVFTKNISATERREYTDEQFLLDTEIDLIVTNFDGKPIVGVDIDGTHMGGLMRREYIPSESFLQDMRKYADKFPKSEQMQEKKKSYYTARSMFERKGKFDLKIRAAELCGLRYTIIPSIYLAQWPTSPQHYPFRIIDFYILPPLIEYSQRNKSPEDHWQEFLNIFPEFAYLHLAVARGWTFSLTIMELIQPLEVELEDDFGEKLVTSMGYKMSQLPDTYTAALSTVMNDLSSDSLQSFLEIIQSTSGGVTTFIARKAGEEDVLIPIPLILYDFNFTGNVMQSIGVAVVTALMSHMLIDDSDSIDYSSILDEIRTKYTTYDDWARNFGKRGFYQNEDR